MNHTFLLSARRRAFTLLELLVVISIIAILAGILLPVANGVLEKAKKTEAKSTEQGIVAAVKTYYTDYSVYPVEVATNATTANDVTFDSRTASPGTATGGHNAVLMDVLRAKNNNSTNGSSPAYKALNARMVTYYENKDVKNTAAPRSGFIPSNGTTPTGFSKGDLVDPWGNIYFVRVDSNYSDIVENPYPASGTSTSITYTNPPTDPTSVTDESTVIRTGVIAWSLGKDQVPGDAKGTPAGSLSTNSDDVVSWQ